VNNTVLQISPISLIEIDAILNTNIGLVGGMTNFPQEVDLRRTPHFLFEMGSMMLSAFSVLFVLAVLPTAALTYFTGSLPLVGSIAVVTFGMLALFGIGLLYWSSTFEDV
jgi:hypothetical protein